MYNVDQKSLINDVNNFSKALENFWNTDEETRRHNAEVARQALEQFKPKVIGDEWEKLIDKCLSGQIPIVENNNNEQSEKTITELISYKIKDNINYAIENIMSNFYTV